MLEAAAALPAVSRHTLEAGIVLEEHRLVYVPAPKAASTAVLWTLVPLAGLSAADFERSTKPEVTRTLAVHDLTIWGGSRRLVGRAQGELDAILHSGRWFRFTVVRDPTRRLWSAWVSKLLLREPRFVATYGHEEWFPRRPRTSTDVVDSFRRFVAVLPHRTREWQNAHWSPQSELVSVAVVPYDLVARAERLTESLGVLTRRLAERGVGIAAPSRENESILPFAPELFDRTTLEASDAVTAPDRDAFGYERLDVCRDEPSAEWIAGVDASIGAIHAVIERNERIADLWRVVGTRASAPRLLRRRAGRRP